MDDARVAAFVADRITTAVVHQSPDLIAARPLILGTAQGLVASVPFKAIIRRAARRAHEAVFSNRSRQIVLSVPDFAVLLRGALAQASPQLAEKIPARLQAVIGSMNAGSRVQVVVDLWRLGLRLRWSALISLVFLAPLLMALSLWLAPDRQRAVVRSGIGLLIAGLLTVLALPVGRIWLSMAIADPLTRGAAQGLWRTYLGGLLNWGLLFSGLGILFAAGASSLLDFDLRAFIRRAALGLATSPVRRSRRLAWGIALLLAGILAVIFPHDLAAGGAVVAGILAAFVGARELFRLVLETAPELPMLATASPKQSRKLRAVIVTGLVLGLGTIWIFLRHPVAAPLATAVTTCNGSGTLCGRRVDQVCFAGAHNSMSNAGISDWMFPHQESDIPHQLRDGIRALLFDVHYGFPGAERIKSDLSGDRPPAEMLEHALGREGMDAALRIRERLVGADEGNRKLYLCHGFCELGAYELEPALESIRDFLIQNPSEVLLIVIEDYVTPDDLRQAFEQTELSELVYTGPATPWPTLGELIDSGQRVIVFLESGHLGVPWLRPAFENIQETPYSFHTPEEFSCAPNRGGTGGSLFQINHWIETTPTPQPSNAAIVNAYDFLLARVRKCAKERKHMPNIIAVDFYHTGDVLKVVQTMNEEYAPLP
ncbi:MAG TPA: hypothetical protein VNM87_15000 [Candidatus Udaeobacter sp.]|nr:hypothetical protein [Candidatus Udaeobacter sp.]